ncbi:MAG: radical SAM protein [Candidatus Bathyarchaeia archaeon]|nr:radical SAM protein [Candidatus Bathyarchaeota archaeon A05DMB-3]
MSLLTWFDPWRSPICTCPPKLTFNPYTGCDHKCVYCYASSYIPQFYECHPKKDLLQRLKREAVRLKGELISISNSSDPYPTMEAETGLTRRCLEILAKCNCRIQIITKSNIVLRDIDLLKQVPSMVALTITTDDEETAKTLEPHAPPPSERLKTAEKLVAEGIPVAVRIDPIIPYVNENPEALVKAIAQIGVGHITASTYKVKADNWQRLNLAMPKTAEKLKPLYFEKGEKIGRYTYLPKSLRLKLMENLAKLAKRYGLKFATCREGLKGLNTATCDGSWLIKPTRNRP